MIFVRSASIYLQIRYKDRPSLTAVRSPIKSAFIHLLLVLLLSGQVKLSPVPTTPNPYSTLNTKYLCGICLKKVDDSHHALLCDKCELWFHTNCLKYPFLNYSTLLNFTSCTWDFTDCGYSNYSHRTPKLNPIISYTSSFLILTNCSYDENDLLNNRIFTSTSVKHK